MILKSTKTKRGRRAKGYVHFIEFAADDDADLNDAVEQATNGSVLIESTGLYARRPNGEYAKVFDLYFKIEAEAVLFKMRFG